MDDHTRVGLRMGLGIFIVTFVGWGLIEPNLSNPKLRSAVGSATNAAAITTVVVNAPCIGKVSQACIDRTLGTILGGWLGYAIFSLHCKVQHNPSSGQNCWDDQGRLALLLSFCGFVLAWASVYTLWHLAHLENTPRLLMLTYVLVAFGSHSIEGSMLVMASRIIGILAGTFLSLMLSVVVFPQSATQGCLKHIKSALAATKELGDNTWQYNVSMISAASDQLVNNWPNKHSVDQQQVALSRRLERERDAGNSQHLGAPSSCLAVSRRPPGMTQQAWRLAVDLRCEEALMRVYLELDQVRTLAPLTEDEYYLGTNHGHLIFLPTSSCLPCRGRWHLPLDTLKNVDMSIRWVARLLWTLHLAFQEGFSPVSARILARHYPASLLQELSDACQGTLQDMVEAFPCSLFTIPSHNLERFKRAVTFLLHISHEHRHKLHKVVCTAQNDLTANAAYLPSKSPHSSSWDEGTFPGVKEGVNRRGGSEPSDEGRVMRDAEEEHFLTPCALSSQPTSGSEGVAPRSLLALASERMASSPNRGLCPLNNEEEMGAAQDDGGDARAYVIEAAGGDSLAMAEGVSLTQPLLSGEAPGGSIPPENLLDIGTAGKGSGGDPELQISSSPSSLSIPKADSGLDAGEVSTHLGTPEDIFLFPDTAEGYCAEMRWSSFQFLVEELAEGLQDLYHSLTELLAQMPTDHISL